jgi:hypothetical protein
MVMMSGGNRAQQAEEFMGVSDKLRLKAKALRNPLDRLTNGRVVVEDKNAPVCHWLLHVDVECTKHKFRSAEADPHSTSLRAGFRLTTPRLKNAWGPFRSGRQILSGAFFWTPI